MKQAISKEQATSGSRTALGASKLIGQLSELVDADIQVRDAYFAERLGRLIDFSGSIALSEAQGNRSRKPANTNWASTRTAQEAFLRVRSVIVQNIMMSFVPSSAHAEAGPPQSKIEAVTDKTLDYEPYRSFYVSHQRDMSVRIQRLHADIQERAYHYSPKLAQLATLDAALGEALAVRVRTFYAVIPTLLGERFEQLKAAYRADEAGCSAWVDEGAGFDRFCVAVKDHLLAEMDIRLEPVLGLVETMHKDQKITEK